MQIRLRPAPRSRRDGARGQASTRTLALIAAALLWHSSALAQGCRLTEVASIDLVASPDGVPLIPAKLIGTPENLWVDLEDPFSYLASDVVSQLQLEEQLLPFPKRDFLPDGPDITSPVKPGPLQFRANGVVL